MNAQVWSPNQRAVACYDPKNSLLGITGELTSGQTVIRVDSFQGFDVATYLPGRHSIQVFIDGEYKTVGIDYNEIDEFTIQLTSPASGGERFSAILFQEIKNWDKELQNLVLEFQVYIEKVATDAANTHAVFEQTVQIREDTKDVYQEVVDWAYGGPSTVAPLGGQNVDTPAKVIEDLKDAINAQAPSLGQLSLPTGSSLVGYKHSSAAINSNVESALKKTFSAWEYFTGIPKVANSPVIGAIRNNGNGSSKYEFWKLIDYSGHSPIGFRNPDGINPPIITLDDRIQILHNIGGNTTLGFQVSLDETLSQTGLRIGCSVGENLTEIFFYRDIFALFGRSASGIWNTTVHNGVYSITWDATNKYLVISHPDCITAGINLTQQGGGSVGEWIAQATQIDKNTTRVYFSRNQGLIHSARIEYKDSLYGIVGNSQNITFDSYDPGTGQIVFNATNGNLFAYDVSVTPYNTSYRCSVATVDGNQIKVLMYKTDGTLVTSAPDVNCKFIIRAQSRIQAEEPGVSTNFAIRWNSRSQINPKSINAVDYPAGNIWLRGDVGRIIT